MKINKIFIGQEDSYDLDQKLDWIIDRFHPDQYKITSGGYLIVEYWVEFEDEKLALLYKLNFS